jgi:hypothetical protein
MRLPPGSLTAILRRPSNWFRVRTDSIQNCGDFAIILLRLGPPANVVPAFSLPMEFGTGLAKYGSLSRIKLSFEFVSY